MNYRGLAGRALGLTSLLLASQIVPGETTQTAPVDREHFPKTVQVLLQGESSDLLRATLVGLGGRITHDLPIVNGIGGILEPDRLAAAKNTPGVTRVTEDFNPPQLPDDRDCIVAGDVALALDAHTLVWRIHNFSEKNQSLQWVEASWPDSLLDAQLSVDPAEAERSQHAGEPLQSGKKTIVTHAMPPGPSLLTLAFSQSTDGLNQNDFNITLGLESCETSLVAAYPDNGRDFYFPSEAGANLLTRAGVTGRGVGVAIIDSGLWDTPALTHDTTGNHRVPAHYDAIRDRVVSSLEDPGGHGSHMASIVANSGKVSGSGSTGYLGIAPNAALIPVTAISPRGDGDFMDIIRGIQWVVANKDALNIRVLNLSLTATPRIEYWHDPMNQAVMKAWEAGIAVVVAAGNDGGDWGTIGSPGNNPYVITVGAFTDSWTPLDQRDDYIPEFSSRGPTREGFIKPDLVAPGGHITGLVPPNSNLARDNPNYFLPTGEFVSTGSSQAAAVVSGIIALLLEVTPDLTNDDVKCLLTTSAEPALSRDGRLAYSPFIQGNGRVNGSRALTVGTTECDQKSLDINAAVAGTETLLGPAQMAKDGSPTLPGFASMVQENPAAAGFSDDRRWGVAAHLQRLDAQAEQPQADGVLFDWGAVYRAEQQKLRALESAKSNDKSLQTQ